MRIGLAMSISEGTYARIPSNSRILVKQHIGSAEVVDADGRGDWRIISGYRFVDVVKAGRKSGNESAMLWNFTWCQVKSEPPVSYS